MTLASSKFPAVVAASLLVASDDSEFSPGWRLAFLDGGEILASSGCSDELSSLVFCSMMKIL